MNKHKSGKSYCAMVIKTYERAKKGEDTVTEFKKAQKRMRK